MVNVHCSRDLRSQRLEVYLETETAIGKWRLLGDLGLVSQRSTFYKKCEPQDPKKLNLRARKSPARDCAPIDLSVVEKVLRSSLVSPSQFSGSGEKDENRVSIRTGLIH